MAVPDQDISIPSGRLPLIAPALEFVNVLPLGLASATLSIAAPALTGVDLSFQPIGTVIARCEIWTDVVANGGTHLGNIGPAEFVSATLASELNGTEDLIVQFDRASSAWAQAKERRVLRTLFVNGVISEHRIIRIQEERNEAGARIATLKAQTILLDLGNALVSRTEQNGSLTTTYTLLSQTRRDLVDHILANAPSYFSRGLLDGQDSIIESFTFDFDTPLSALQELIDQEELELSIHRNADVGYLVNVVNQIGSNAIIPQFRYRKNIKGIKREVDSSELANRIYPAGASNGVSRLTIADARWEVTLATDPPINTINLIGDPVFEDDHLKDLYVEKPDESLIQIFSTTTPAQVRFSAAHGLTDGDLIKFRLNASGDELIFVESPSSQTDFGVVTGIVQADDLPSIDNLVLNPTLSDFVGGVPDNWNAVVVPISRNTDTLFTKVGGASAHIQPISEVGRGIRSDSITISPTAPDLFFSAFVTVFVVSGSVELFLQHSVSGRFPPIGDAGAFTTKTGQFITLLIEGVEFAAGTLQLWILSLEINTEFYIDSAQLTNTAQALPFFDGQASQTLWRRGLEALTELSQPRVAYNMSVIDLGSVAELRGVSLTASVMSLSGLPTPDYRYSEADLFRNRGISDGDAVTTWDEMQGTGLDLGSATSDHTLIVAGPNGQPYVDFPGTQSTGVFNKDRGSAWLDASRHTMFVVAKNDTQTDDKNCLSNWGLTPTGDINNYTLRLIYGNSATSHRLLRKTGPTTTVAGTSVPTSGSWHVYAYRTGDPAINDLEVYYDSGTSEGGPTNIATPTVRTLTLGGRWTSTGTGLILPLDGGIAEVFIYDSILSDANVTAVINAFKTHYGI